MVGLELWAVDRAQLVIVSLFAVGLSLGPVIYHTLRAILAAACRTSGPSLIVLGYFGPEISNFNLGAQRIVVKAGFFLWPTLAVNTFYKIRDQSGDTRLSFALGGMLTLPETSRSWAKEFAVSLGVSKIVDELPPQSNQYRVSDRLKIFWAGIISVFLLVGIISSLWSYFAVLRVRADAALVVASVTEGSSAHSAGLRPGMEVQQVDKSVLSVPLANQTTATAAPAEEASTAVTIEVLKNDGKQNITFIPGPENGVTFGYNYVTPIVSDALQAGFDTAHTLALILPSSYLPEMISWVKSKVIYTEVRSIPLQIGNNWPKTLFGQSLGLLFLPALFFGFMVAELFGAAIALWRKLGTIREAPAEREAVVG